jgi:hypothetical protein
MHRFMRAALVPSLLVGGLLIGTGCGQVAETARGLVGAAPTATATPRPPTLTPIPTAPPRPAAVATAQPASRDVVIEVSEADLNAQLAQLLVGQSLGSTPIGDATVHSVTVGLRDGQIQVRGQAVVGMLGAPFSVTGSIVPDATGRPRVSVSSAQVGGFGLPEPVAARSRSRTGASASWRCRPRKRGGAGRVIVAMPAS